jgi:hypothetical protein
VGHRGDEVVLHPVELAQLLVSRSDLPYKSHGIEGEAEAARDRHGRGEYGGHESATTRHIRV